MAAHKTGGQSARKKVQVLVRNTFFSFETYYYNVAFQIYIYFLIE